MTEIKTFTESKIAEDKAVERVLDWYETKATEAQKRAFDCLSEAIGEVFKEDMHDVALSISFCKQRDLLGDRPVMHIHNFKDFSGLANFYEYCAARIKSMETGE